MNILPQKKWNVYNYENREKVRQDEELLIREQSRRRDGEFRIEILRRSGGLSSSSSSSKPPSPAETHSRRRINPLSGLNGFSHLSGLNGLSHLSGSLIGIKQAREEADAKEGGASKKRRRVDFNVKKVLMEDDKYRLGYGLVGRGIETLWYASKPPSFMLFDDGGAGADGGGFLGKNSWGRKTVEELREKQDKERQSSLLASLASELSIIKL